MVMRETVDISRLAGEIFNTCLGAKSGDRVWIQTWNHTLELAKALAYECPLRICPYLLTVRYEDIWLRSIFESPKERLESVDLMEAAALAQTDAFIFTMGPRSPIPWSLIPKKKRDAVSVWLDTRYDNSAYAKEWARIASNRRVKMLGIEATLATRERAKASRLDYENWRDVMLQGCLADHNKIATKCKALDRTLSGKGRVSITTTRGTDLELDLDKRPTDISDGIANEKKAEKAMVTFLPAGDIEVSVDEESANGTVVYDIPARRGNTVVKMLKVRIRDGQVVDHQATQGNDLFKHYVKEGGRDAGRFAFIGFGLNPKLKFGYTQDDKVLGGITIGFGDNKTKGGKNRANSEWWASISKGTVTVDGMPVMKAGKLLV
jgi:leucyl aminopeptidase (aminopeptidase T)